MNEADRATHLRERAARLRTLAIDIERLPVMHLDGSAGADTWQGTRPSLCVSTLVTNQHQLHGAAEDLRRHAYLLDQRAGELEAIARLRIELLDHRAG